MLIVSNSRTILDVYANSKSPQTTFIINMSSATIGFTLFDRLMPLVTIDPESKDFDLMYMNYLLSDDIAFSQLMMIIYNLYIGVDVLIMIGETDIKYMVAESLLKFIQQRYGYNGYIINEASDVEFLNEGSFTIQGLYNLDIDKERYSPILLEMEKLKNTIHNPGGF